MPERVNPKPGFRPTEADFRFLFTADFRYKKEGQGESSKTDEACQETMVSRNCGIPPLYIWRASI